MKNESEHLALEIACTYVFIQQFLGSIAQQS